jgi:hypothetical protein
LGKLDFVHTRVKYNKREAAYDLFHSRGYRLPGFYYDVNSLSPDDGSDWTKEDNNRFRAALFEHHENMIDVSDAIGKPINQYITNYLVKFKRTKSYKSLKRSMKRKANMSGGVADVTLVCNECSKGGMLIACDTCEAHYHLACALPPLESIPDGTWICGNCRRETRSMLSSQDEMSCGTDQHEGGDVSMNGGNDFAEKEMGNDFMLGGAVAAKFEVTAYSILAPAKISNLCIFEYTYVYSNIHGHFVDDYRIWTPFDSRPVNSKLWVSRIFEVMGFLTI